MVAHKANMELSTASTKQLGGQLGSWPVVEDEASIVSDLQALIDAVAQEG